MLAALVVFPVDAGRSTCHNNSMVRVRKALAGVLVLVASVLTAGVPVTHEADHDDDHAHVEHAHGGHSSLVVLETGRVTSVHWADTAFQVSPIGTLELDLEVPSEVPRPVDPVLHAGRSPPTSRFPRGPPHTHI